MAGGHTTRLNGNVDGPVQPERELILHDGSTQYHKQALFRGTLIFLLPDLKP